MIPEKVVIIFKCPELKKKNTTWGKELLGKKMLAIYTKPKKAYTILLIYWKYRFGGNVLLGGNNQ